MPYYAPSAYYPLPGAPQAAAPPRLPQQQLQQQYAQPAQPQLDQVYLRQQEQAQAYQQQQLQQQQYLEQQNRQLAQQQHQQQQQQQYALQHQRLQQQQLQQKQYAAQQQQRLQQQQYAQQQQQGYGQQQQQYQQSAAPIRQQQQQRSASPAAPLYKSSDYVQAGGVYSTGGVCSQPLRRVASRADVNTAIENQEAPYQSFGQGQQGVTQYNPYATYGQTVHQSPIRQQGNSQREPSVYAFDGLNPDFKQQQQYSQERDLPTARELPSASNVWMGARSLNTPTTVVLDANNNAAAPLLPRSPARGYGTQKGYGSGGAQAESAYISIPNNLVYAQTNAERAYNNSAQESRPVYASSSRTNQASSTPQLKPAAARALYAALSSENVRTALERDAPIVLAQAPTYSTYNGQKVQGRAFAIPAEQKFSEYNIEELNGLRSVIDR